MVQELFDAATMHGPGKPDWPSHAIMAFTRKELNLFSKKHPNGRQAKPILGGLTQIFIFPDFVLAGPILGAPMAGMALETLSRRGCTSLLSLGWCGALSSSLRWGATSSFPNGPCQKKALQPIILWKTHRCRLIRI